MVEENKIYVLSDGTKVAKDRSCGVVLCPIIEKDNEFYILCNKRGSKTSEAKRKWNLPSGYINWGEDGKEASLRECFEECGIDIPKELTVEAEHSTDPSENRQNILFRYIAKLPEEYLSKRLNSDNADNPDEVTNIKWIKLSEIDKYDFAWTQLNTIKRLVKKSKMFDKLKEIEEILKTK